MKCPTSWIIWKTHQIPSTTDTTIVTFWTKYVPLKVSTSQRLCQRSNYVIYPVDNICDLCKFGLKYKLIFTICHVFPAVNFTMQVLWKNYWCRTNNYKCIENTTFVTCNNMVPVNSYSRLFRGKLQICSINDAARLHVYDSEWVHGPVFQYTG